MFHNSKYLVYPPAKLPALQLAERCYVDMFNGCSKLVESPEIMYKGSLDSGCFMQMFYHCSQLSTLKIHFSGWGSGATNWMAGVPEGGNWYCPASLLSPPLSLIGGNGLPANWEKHADYLD